MILFLLLAMDGLVETTSLDTLRASLVLDAAQSGEKVLFFYFDIGSTSVGQDLVLYNFDTGEAVVLKDGRMKVLSDAIVAQRGMFYIESKEQVVVVDPEGGFAGKLRLATFEGWEDGLTVDLMEHEGDRVVALCSMTDEESQFLVHLDFATRRAEIQPIELPTWNPYYDLPKYSVIPFEGQFLRIEVHTSEVVQLNRDLEPVRTLQSAQAPREVYKQRTGRTHTVEVLTQPFVVTAAGLSGKYLVTHNLDGDRLEESIPRGFVVEPEKRIVYRDEVVIGRHGEDELLWHRPENLVYRHSAREPATSGDGSSVAEARRRR